ncbi:MAG TPA: GNAT family N-acetyltransferase [Leptolyngbyaceae cyanobacterium]
MKTTIVSGKSLTPEHLLLWSHFQQSNAALANPYFCPEFTSAVAEVREDAWVGILKEAGEIVGFFPFQRGKLPIGQPVGYTLCDYQGLIVKPGFNWDAAELLRGCGLKIWNFDNLIASQLPFQRFHKLKTESLIIDLSGGQKAYESEQKANSNWIQQTERKLRKFEREVGALRFETHVADTSLLRLLMRWKSQHYSQLGTFDRFEIEWIVKLIERLHATQSDTFAGMLSVLYVGDEVAALHFGMRSVSVWHYWFPTYNPEFQKYSPGLILLLKMIEAAESLGIQTIDLGKGDESYKQRLINSTVPLAEGSVEVPSLISTARWLRRKTVEIVRSPKRSA